MIGILLLCASMNDVPIIEPQPRISACYHLEVNTFQVPNENNQSLHTQWIFWAEDGSILDWGFLGKCDWICHATKTAHIEKYANWHIVKWHSLGYTYTPGFDIENNQRKVIPCILRRGVFHD